MPRVAGLNVVAVLAAGVVFYIVGMVIYGFALSEVWQQQTLMNHGMATEQATALKGEALMQALSAIPGTLSPGMAYGIGFLLCLLSAVGIGLVLKMAKPASIGAALGVAFMLWVFFAATGLAYNVVYSNEFRIIFGIDLLYTFLGFMLAAAALFLIDGKAMGGAAARPAV